jgi:AmmeMemoRadiSam system protein B
MPLPRFRPLVKVVPWKQEGKDIFVVMDHQEALFDHQVALPPMAFVVAAFLDGRREVADVQKAIADNLKGVQVGPEEVEAVVRDLDEHFLLETDRVERRRREVEQEYLGLAARPPRFVTGSADEVTKELDGYFEGTAGAGRPGAPGADGLAAIMAPHIDFRRGGTCYTFAYRELAERSDADVYVIFGVAHLSPPNPFILTTKDYETPLGPVRTDRGLVEEVASRAGKHVLEFESLHRSEHSIEFQSVFLKKARPEAKFTVVPILCSSFEPHCGDASPSTVPRIAEFLEALGEAVRGRKVCLVAGVDLAHVGPVFGDDVALDEKLVEWMMAGDTRSLRACMEGNAEAFWNTVMADGNRRHVCGLSATYSTLKVLGEAQGKVHKYGFAPDPQGGFVSFASMSFRRASTIILP